ncbi:ATP-dependent helicase HrpA [Methylomarinovum caldicuralii]|uniref:ATP-dependent helicase HrpA n=1 Tax=Methylomarinovum caldicuralii TaxID=438856 RepID=A0AAU9BT12_9GAMM|nr:ATP-dependent RNA helicase HrpA [Methylomarinovum caldicuralii]BCX82038.1 ATP-dependent helicase HrpA [Methylomarinovum caldicuralii]
MNLDELQTQLERCQSRDRHRLARQLQRLKDLDPARLERLRRELEASVAATEARRSRIPPLAYPELPVAAKKDDIAAALQEHQVVVVCGETGSGKTTQLPKICLEIGRGTRGMIGHTQPRRIAARSVAARIAAELKTPLGALVGFKVRFSDHTRPETLVKLMTDGILLAETQSDRYLTQYDALIIDEAHERSLNIDFLLGYLKWLLPRRPDLKLIVTSATIDPQRFSEHFGGAPIIEVSGRSYPVEVRYRPLAGEGESSDQDLIQAILEGVDELAAERLADILVFLTGERDIRDAAEALRKHHPEKYEILPLYARLSAREQQKVFQPGGRPRIVLATNVAETSLTVPGIRAVIDSGLARISRYSPRSKLQRLPIEPVSQASARQRAGRCGRIAPGVCLRLYSEEDFLSRPAFTDPEIRRTNLAAVILQMKALRLGDIETFPFIDPPDPRQIRAGIKLLQELQALDGKGELTAIGRQLIKFPIDPRLARMLVAARDENCLTELTVIAAALSIQDPRERPADQAQAADEKHALWRDEKSDFLGFLKLWNGYQQQRRHLSNTQLRKWCKAHFLSYLRMREWLDLHGQLLEIVKGELGWRPNQQPAEYDAIHRAILSGLLSQIGFRRDKYEYEGVRGLKFFIFPGSGLFQTRPRWLVSAEQVETSKVYARINAQVEPAWIEQCAGHLLKRHHYDPHWERKARRVAAFERVTLCGLTLVERRKVAYEKIDPKKAREIFIAQALVQQDYDCNLDFFCHNRALLRELDLLQHKARQGDLLLDERWLYDFYDRQIPARLANADDFERWYRRQVRNRPDLLKLDRDAVIRHLDGVDQADFPDHWEDGDLRLALRYRFEPGHEADGVSVLVPVAVLPQLDARPFAWLVPGLLEENVVFILKGLPRSLRRRLVPIPDTAWRVCRELQGRDGDFWAELSRALLRVTGVEVGADALKTVELPDHLQMNFQVLGERGRVLAQGRDLERLKTKLALSARETFARSDAGDLTRTGLKRWDFGPLPRSHKMRRKGQLVIGFPALVDEGDSCAVRLFPTSGEARRAHRRGLIRMLQFQLGGDFRRLKKQLPFSTADEIAYARLPAHPWRDTGPRRPLLDEVADRVIEEVFLGDDPDIRDAEALASCLAAHRSRLFETAQRLGTLVRDILQGLQACRRRRGELKHLEKSPSGADIDQQLTLLGYQGFVARIPMAQLQHLPRYLKALQYRLDKAEYELAKDEARVAKIRPFWDAYWRQAEAGTIEDPDSDPFRWSLEEFRVSLFAQQIKTAYPVSEKRLAKAWAEYQAA